MASPDFATQRSDVFVEFDARGERLVLPIRLGWKAYVGSALAIALGHFSHLHTISRLGPWIQWLLYGLFGVAAAGLILALAASRFAHEFVEVRTGMLVLGWRLFGFERKRSYPVADISNLGRPIANYVSPRPGDTHLVSLRGDVGKRGSVKFDTSDRSVYFGITLSDDAADDAVAWLARRLPLSVTA